MTQGFSEWISDTSSDRSRSNRFRTSSSVRCAIRFATYSLFPVPLKYRIMVFTLPLCYKSSSDYINTPGGSLSSDTRISGIIDFRHPRFPCITDSLFLRL